MKIKSNKDLFLSSEIKILQQEEDADSGTITITGFANCTTKDRAGDVIIEDAWKGDAMTNYMKNPIILAFHDHSQPIGKMTDFSVNSKGLEITAEISKSAGNVYNLIKEGILKAFSVGFRVKDADYDSATDIFLIKEVELHEVSVVSVPCNQDSTFSVSKSFDSDADVTAFKKQFEETAPIEPVIKTDLTNDDGSTKDADHQTDNIEEDFIMDPKDLAKQIAEGVAAAMAVKEAADAKAAAEKAAVVAEDARIVALVKSGSEELLNTLEVSRKEDSDKFAAQVEELQTTIAEKSEEIQALQKGGANFTDRSGTEEAAISPQEADDAVFLSKILSKGMFDTNYGETLRQKAVNQSSSGAVSSQSYESIFSTNIERDIQDILVMAPLFREINMTSANLTLPIRPDAAQATWVAADEVSDQAGDLSGTNRTVATTGANLTMALTEITLTTKKLAGKTFITDETDEDVLIPLLPLLRDSLIEAHQKTWDETLIQSTGGGGTSPIGLISRAATAGGNYVGVSAKSAGSATLITALDLLGMRRAMGQWGLNLADLTLVVNIDCYWDLLEDSTFHNINEVGSMAAKVTGQVGSMFGLPVVVSTQFATPAVNSVFAMLINRKNFMVPRQRGLIVQSDYDVEKQRRIVVATQRVGFNETIVGKGVATMQYAAA